MFTITDTAADKAQEILKDEGKQGWGLRIYFAGSSCCGPSYGMDMEEASKTDDKVIEKNGLKVFTDNDTFDKLTGMRMDYVDDGQHQGFVIVKENPEQGGSGCSCGSSCH